MTHVGRAHNRRHIEFSTADLAREHPVEDLGWNSGRCQFDSEFGSSGELLLLRTQDEWMKARSIAKLQKKHDRMAELVQSMAHDRRDLGAALDQLKRRYEGMNVVVYP